MLSFFRALFLVAFIVLGGGISSCAEDSHFKELLPQVVSKSEGEYELLYRNIQPYADSLRMMPRTYGDGQLRLVSVYDWTSGFYPGTLWYLYALTNEDKWKERAMEYTLKMDTVQYWAGNHDLGFMMECSYGNALKAAPSKELESVIVQTAKSLGSRFSPKVGAIKSWDWSEKWKYPVIIDNMMNLEVLFNATKISGDSSYYKIAVSHADKTLQHHFRDNNSSFHVLDYDPETGNVLNKNTHQGYSDSSSWARGQAWGLYGYTMCYRETGLKRYLDQAIAIAEYIMDSPNMPKDGIPLWDYDAPKGEGAEPRDASAACITASALYELAVLTDSPKGKFGQWADRIIDHLATPEYFPGGEANGGFLLGHSVGSLPHGVEVDVPLNYADYYFLEALLRKKNIMGL